MRSILPCKFSTPTRPSLYSGISTLCAQKPVFDIVHDESVKVYPHMYNGNVQQNPLCVESCVTKEFSMSPRFSPAFFSPDADSVLLRAHLCTAVDCTRRKPCVRNCSRKREGLYIGSVQQNPLCAASCDANSVLLLLLAHLCTAVLIRSLRRTVFEIVHDESLKVYPHMYNGNVQQNPLCVKFCVTKDFSMFSRFSSTSFDPDANSVHLRGHLCTAVDSSIWARVYQKLCTLTNQNIISGLLCILSAWTI